MRMMISLMCFAALLAPVDLLAGRCGPIVQDLMEWDKQDDSENTFYVVLGQVAINKNRGNKTHYHLTRAPVNAEEGAILVTSPHKIAHFNWNSSGYLFSFNDFEISREDRVTILVNRNNSGEVILHDWGDTSIPLKNVECSQDRFGSYVTGRYEENNGTSLLSITMNKRKLNEGQKREW